MLVQRSGRTYHSHRPPRYRCSCLHLRQAARQHTWAEAPWYTTSKFLNCAAQLLRRGLMPCQHSKLNNNRPPCAQPTTATGVRSGNPHAQRVDQNLPAAVRPCGNNCIFDENPTAMARAGTDAAAFAHSAYQLAAPRVDFPIRSHFRRYPRRHGSLVRLSPCLRPATGMSNDAQKLRKHHTVCRPARSPALAQQIKGMTPSFSN